MAKKGNGDGKGGFFKSPILSSGNSESGAGGESMPKNNQGTVSGPSGTLPKPDNPMGYNFPNGE